MAIKTYAEQLAEVQAAITKIVEGGQSYTIKDRSYTRADLAVLYERESYLMNKVSGRRGPTIQVGVVR